MTHTADFYRFVAAFIDSLEADGKSLGKTDAARNRNLSFLYRAGYRSYEEVMAASAEELLSVTGIGPSAVKALKGAESLPADSRWSFVCERCGKVFPNEGKRVVTRQVRDRLPSGNMGTTYNKSSKLCQGCGDEVFAKVDEMIGGSE